MKVLDELSLALVIVCVGISFFSSDVFSLCGWMTAWVLLTVSIKETK